MLQKTLSLLAWIAISIALLFVAVWVISDSNAAGCRQLQAAGYRVELIERTCYAEVGAGLYLPVQTDEQPCKFNECNPSK